MGNDKEHKDKDKKKDKKEKKKDKSHKERSSHSRHKHEKSRRRTGSDNSDEDRGHHKHRHHDSDRKKSRGHQRDEKRKRSPSAESGEREISSKQLKIETEDFNDGSTLDDTLRRQEERNEGTGGEGEMEKRGGGGGAGLELSIEETNKLRLQLGLKPLDVGPRTGGESKEGEKTDNDTKDNEEEEEEEAPKKKEDVHVPAKNIGEEKKAEKIREKLELMRESRNLARKLATVRGLGQDTSTDESATNWVTKMREKEREKKLAEQRAQLLEEMDGGYDENEERVEETKKDSYSSHNLAGLTIEHKEDRFQEGRDVILTLKDTKILDDGEDVLVNVSMIDDEKGQRNIEMKKNLPGYQPYEEEFDEYGNPITRSLLYKYDEEIEGQKIHKFTLGDTGQYDVGDLQREKERAREVLEQKAIALDLPQLSVASEYYTEEEMVKFRKRKKRKRKEKFKVEDLVSLDNEGGGGDGRDHGSRQRDAISDEPMETNIKPDPSLLDDTDTTVDTALERTRRLLKRKTAVPDTTGAARVASMLVPKIKTEKMEDEDEERLAGEAENGLIVIDTTAEFCRQIGEEESELDKSKWKNVGDTELMEEGDQDIDGGWSEIDPNNKQNETTLEKPDVLELEAKTHLTGVAAALQMATKKGFIDSEKDKEAIKKKKGDSKTIIEGLGTRDWEYERDRGRERERDKDTHGRDMAFVEKKDYVPEVNIEYVDDHGRLLTAKEAFRHMSHKFHGKGPGKKKVEKLIKRRKEDVLLSKSDAGDTPLQSLELLRKKQEVSQSAYVVLTGQQHQQPMHIAELSKRK
ncbi:PREDICTED: U4/U6.U5 tri-snRNP-associated protein 1-like [Amphimedon queenslandica]|uniref:U4/U6.U5 tri-snRNP-associated protein 1 n=1 Tax=Amphimedon queenslandica TaxID=400682 RepID=A0A1X7VW41_AMPQE|nr:PREDICTED: U4/U6.U5 tri-snRNP-associated protein 1-like [Amphimedon queenslandica]|eukprot:XP_019850472.1 PREDICTED: U4/U6.U5 tri-snRNP-associated protein 1-like [Amphimedon queenslandica]